MSVKESSKLKRYELAAPDGGWGYMIWIALTINMISITAIVSSLGLVYNEIYIQLKMDSTSITLLTSIGAMSVSIAGFVTEPLLSCVSIRKLGMISAIMLNLGAFAVIFVNSKELFFLSSGVLQCFGNGVLLNLTFTVLNQYFVKKRMLTVAVIHTVTAVVSLFLPQFVKWASEEYGCRGTLILISGMNMQSFVAIALMQPVKWHLRKIEIGTKYEEKDTEIKTLINRNETEREILRIPAAKQSGTESLTSMSVEKKEFSDSDIKEDTKNNSLFREMFSNFLDIPFLKSFLLSNASIGLAMCTFSDVIFMMILPQALYFMDWTEGEVAWAISLNNFGDLVMKVLFILFNKFLLKFGSTQICIVGIIMAFFTRLGLLWSNDPTVMLIFIVMMGMSRSILAMLCPLVIGDSVDKEKFTSAMGIYMLLYGIIFLILGPTIGAIRDLTNSYGTAFYIVTSFYAIVSLFWLIELLYKKNKNKRIKKIQSKRRSA